MREQPDPLAEYVLALLEAARTSPLSREEVCAELIHSLRRDVAYLLRRKRLGRQTAYDEALEETLKVRARAIVLLEQPASTGSKETGEK